MEQLLHVCGVLGVAQSRIEGTNSLDKGRNEIATRLLKFKQSELVCILYIFILSIYASIVISS